MNTIVSHVIGIDPGLASLGWGVLAIEKMTPAAASVYRGHDTSKVYHVGHGVIETSSEESLGNRLLYIEQSIDAIFSRYEIITLSYEKQFFVKNVTSGLNVAHALGVILLYAAKQNIRVTSFTPREIKQMITGKANAPKTTVQKFLCMQLGLDVIDLHHAADALGAALSYYYKHSSISHDL